MHVAQGSTSAFLLHDDVQSENPSNLKGLLRAVEEEGRSLKLPMPGQVYHAFPRAEFLALRSRGWIGV